MIQTATRSGTLKFALAPLILAALVLLAYWNTFEASWHLDDYANITDNRVLHLDQLELKSLFQTFYSMPTKPGVIGRTLYRPVPCMTFALNWHFGGDNVRGYHLVNISVHILTAWILFAAVLSLLKTPNLVGNIEGGQILTAFVCAALWALSPIQTQAVTYIVQRMAAMAAMFSILSTFFYLKFRLDDGAVKRIVYLLGCIMGIILALGSKENSVILPVAILLIEVICFQDLDQRRVRRTLIWVSIGIGIVLIAAGLLVLTPERILSILKGYGNRPFSLSERLLTEPRVLIFYLPLILYPTPNRLSIVHDIEVSTSLLQPWTTLPSILLVAGLIGFGLGQIRKRPLVALAILFFFLGHVVESTIIPLELIFEHRNYLPSLFLFLPVAAGFSRFLAYLDAGSAGMKPLAAGGMVVIIGCLIGGTYLRNLAWATEKTLWEDAMRKAPQSVRPLHNLAWSYYTRSGQYDKALMLYEQSLNRQENNNFSKSTALNNMALIYYHRKNFARANALWKKALQLNPRLDLIRYRYVLGLVEAADWKTARHQVDVLLAKHPKHIDYNYIKGRILLNQGDYGSARSQFENCLKLKPDATEIMLNLGICHYLLGQPENAETVFRNALGYAPGDLSTLMWLIQTNIKADDSIDIDRYVTKLIEAIPSDRSAAYLENIFNDPYMPPDAVSDIIQRIGSKQGQPENR